MDNYVLFFSDKCPDTKNFVLELKNLNIKYEEINITNNMKNLKRFLSLRDNKKEFDAIKNSGFIGIPVLVLNEEKFIFTVDELKNII